jgi:signal transduction histidine kinase
VLEELQTRLEPAARQSHSRIAVDCPQGLWARATPLALRSAIENVAANSLDALLQTGRAGALTLRAARLPSGEVEVLVTDDGPGVSEQMRERLFLPFTSDKAAGTGLGLAIARALARACGGELVLSGSSPGSTTFRFTFPGLPGQGET